MGITNKELKCCMRAFVILLVWVCWVLWVGCYLGENSYSRWFKEWRSCFWWCSKLQWNILVMFPLKVNLLFIFWMNKNRFNIWYIRVHNEYMRRWMWRDRIRLVNTINEYSHHLKCDNIFVAAITILMNLLAFRRLVERQQWGQQLCLH